MADIEESNPRDLPPHAAHPALRRHLENVHVRLGTVEEWRHETAAYDTETKTAATKALVEVVKLRERVEALDASNKRLVSAFEGLTAQVRGMRDSIGELASGVGRLLRASVDNERLDAQQNAQLQVVEQKYSTLTVAKYGAGAGAFVAVSQALEWAVKAIWAAVFGP